MPYPSIQRHLAAVQEPAGVGRLRGLDLLHHLAAVLVPGAGPRPGGAARLVARARPSASSTACFALGWRGSGRHWAEYKWAYLLLAGLSTPLVLSVHTIVSFDFATSVLPGLAHHHLPAVLRRRRHLLGLRDGRDLDGARPGSSSGSSTS